MIGINQQALLVICGYLGKLGFSFIETICALKRTRFIIQYLRKQIIGLIFFRVLFDNLLEHLNRFSALVRQNETGRQFFPCVGVIWLQFDYAKIKRDRLLKLL